MIGQILAGASPVAASKTGERVYRAVWRWHFYAGLLCLPFLVSLATSGALYLFKDEINATVFAYRTTVPVGFSTFRPDRLVLNAWNVVPDGVPVSYQDPASPASTAVVTMSEGDRRTLVYLDPYTGNVLDRVDRDGEFFMVLRRLHSLAFFGPWANVVIEIVAGFAIILVVTGTFLSWPRGQPGGVVTVRGTPRRRVWWRDVHAVTGIVAGIGLFFLALTGLPWSYWWGDQVRTLTNRAGLGQPTALWANKPVLNKPMREILTSAGWTMEDAPVPLSQPSSRGASPIGLNRATEILAERGMPHGYELSLPNNERGVFAAAAYPRDVTRQRMISLDQYTGQALGRGLINR